MQRDYTWFTSGFNNFINKSSRIKKLFPVLTFLKEDNELDYNILMDVLVVDYLKYPVRKRERFEVV